VHQLSNQQEWKETITIAVATRTTATTIVLAVLMVLGGLAALTSAAWASDGSQALAEEPSGEASGEQEEEEEPPNEIAVFIGSTQGEKEDGGRDDPRFTVGLDYVRRLSSWFGIGGFIDLVAEGGREGLAGIPLFFHAGRSATFMLAPSVQRTRETKDFEYATRLGFIWKFELRRIILAPAIYYDILEDEEFVVVGLNVVRAF